jgi:hypothetical protein
LRSGGGEPRRLRWQGHDAPVLVDDGKIPAFAGREIG